MPRIDISNLPPPKGSFKFEEYALSCTSYASISDRLSPQLFCTVNLPNSRLYLQSEDAALSPDEEGVEKHVY